MIYLDNSATTKMDEAAAKIALSYMCEQYYNPAAAYAASALIEKDTNTARNTVAASLGCKSEEILFTSGGTESNNMAVNGTLKKWRGPGKIITTAVEHPSVMETVRTAAEANNLDLVILPVDEKGAPDIEMLKESLDETTALVSMMHVNNELGTISDIHLISRIIRERAPRAVFHADGVQGFLKCPVNAEDMDMYSISAHKFHGPKGVGILYVKKGVPFAGGQLGGGQEHNLRSGTLNVPGIMSAAAAIDVYERNKANIRQDLQRCKERLYNNLTHLQDVILNGPDVYSGAPHILNMSFLGVRSAVLINALSSLGTYVSAGSACSSHKKNGNRILNACGITGVRQEGAVRFSFGRFNTPEEMDTVSTQIEDQLKFLRKYRRR